MRQDFFFNLKISELLLFFKIMALIPDPDIWQKKKIISKPKAKRSHLSQQLISRLRHFKRFSALEKRKLTVYSFFVPRGSPN